jgi:hypothetical protein
MARGINRLSAIKVTKLSKPGRYADGGGLWLQISKWKTKSFTFRYMLDGRARHMGLGSLQTVTLADARQRARQARMLLLDGTDPIAQRQQRRSGARQEAASRMTFEQAASTYIAFAGETWKNEKHRAQWPSTLKKYAYPILGDLPVAAIETQHVLRVVEPIWKKKTETGQLARRRRSALALVQVRAGIGSARGMTADDNPNIEAW